MSFAVTPETFSTRLRRLVADRGLALRKLGLLSGVTSQNLPAYLDGSVSPRTDTAIALAAALRVPAAWLAFGQEVNPESRPDLAVFPGNLRMFRKARGLTQTELADQAGISAMTVSALERADRLPSIEQAIAMASALATSPALLAFGQHPADTGSHDPGVDAKWATMREHRDQVALAVISRLSFSADSAIALRVPAGDLCSLLKLEPTKKNRAYVEKLWEEMTTYFPVFVRRLAGKLIEPS